MAEQRGEQVVQAWNAHRPYLIDLAYRMLGDIGAAEDVVQDAFSRLLRFPPGEIEDDRGWLIVVTSRLCLGSASGSSCCSSSAAKDRFEVSGLSS